MTTSANKSLKSPQLHPNPVTTPPLNPAIRAVQTTHANDIPVAHPVDQPVAPPVVRMIVEATSYPRPPNVTWYCRSCGDMYVPDASLRSSAQFFRCPRCTDNRAFVHMVKNSCVLM